VLRGVEYMMKSRGPRTLTSKENFTEIVPENLFFGGVKHKRGSQI